MEEVPLLQAFWADIENASPAERGNWPSIKELQQRYPNQLILYLKHHGVKKLGETRIAATDLQELFGGEALLTRGSKSCDLDWVNGWGIQPLDKTPECEGDIDGGTSRPSSLRTSSRYGWLQQQQWLSRRCHAPHDQWGLSRASAPAPSLSSVTAEESGATTSTPLPALPRSPELPPTPTVVVESYLVAVRDAAAPGEAGLLRPLLRRWQLGSCSAGVFGLPVVQAVVAYKWSRFARRLLLKQLAAYALWLGSFTGFMMLFNSSDAAITDAELLISWQGRAAVVFEVLALLGMLPFAVAEVCVVAAYGLVGWLSAWNLLDCTTYGLQVAISVLHLGMFTDGPYWLTFAVAAQAILLVVRLTFFSRVFKSTTFDFMGSLQAVLGEVGWYVAVLLLLMWGFACAFFTIFRDDDAVTDSFKSLPLALLTMLNYAVGGTSYYTTALLASAQPAAAVLLCTTYQFLVSMLLMSLLTGVMTNALMRTNEEEAVALVLNRAQVIDELETVLPPPLLQLITSYRRGRSKSGAAAPTAAAAADREDSWTPYIHVLRVNPACLERIDGAEKLWPSAAMVAAASNGALEALGTARAAPAGARPVVGRPAIVDSMRDGGGGGGSGGTVAAKEDAGTVGRLEAQVRRLECQVADLQGVVRQLLELNGDVRQVLDVVRRANVQLQPAVAD